MSFSDLDAELAGTVEVSAAAEDFMRAVIEDAISLLERAVDHDVLAMLASLRVRLGKLEHARYRRTRTALNHLRRRAERRARRLCSISR